jgi:glycerophosphoryl diester phosphodiesterase
MPPALPPDRGAVPAHGPGRSAAGVPAISAHRGGSDSGAAQTCAGYQQAVVAGADYIELDVRQTADGVLVACHRERLGRRGAVASSLAYRQLCDLAGYQVPRLDAAMALLAGRAAAHLDLKDAHCAVAAAGHALCVLGAGHVLATTRDPAVAAELGASYPALAVGVTVGGDLPETARFAARRVRYPAISRLDTILTAGAGWAIVHRRLARAGLLTECRSRGLRTMVWTVNSDRALASWLASPDVDALVTDRPGRAAAIRAQSKVGSGDGARR